MFTITALASLLGACSSKPEHDMELLRQSLAQQAGELDACTMALRQAQENLAVRQSEYEALMQELVRTKVERDQLQVEMRARRRLDQPVIDP